MQKAGLPAVKVWGSGLVLTYYVDQAQGLSFAAEQNIR